MIAAVICLTIIVVLVLAVLVFVLRHEARERRHLVMLIAAKDPVEFTRLEAAASNADTPPAERPRPPEKQPIIGLM